MSVGPPTALPSVLAALGPDDTAVIGIDLDLLDRRLDLLRSAFPEGTEHAVAIKTMPHPAVLAHLVDAGFGLEAASMEEVDLALAAGAPPRRIVFDSPVKTRREIARCAAELPGLLLNANSIDELERVPPDGALRLGLRINPLVASGSPELFDVSTPTSKFGVPLDRRDDIVAAALAHPLDALHCHVSSQAPTFEAHLAAAAALVDLADEIDDERAATGDPRRIRFLDIGGGLAPEPLPATGDGPTSLERYASAVAALAGARSRTLVTELGQWVHTWCGWTASRVEYVRGGDRPMAYLHVGADLLVRHTYATPTVFEVVVVGPDGAPRSGPTTPVDLVGPLCFAGDVLGRGLDLPEIHEGDWVVISPTGANTYGLWSRHCSRDVPAVVAVRGHEVAWRTPRRPIQL